MKTVLYLGTKYKESFTSGNYLYGVVCQSPLLKLEANFVKA